MIFRRLDEQIAGELFEFLRSNVLEQNYLLRDLPPTRPPLSSITVSDGNERLLGHKRSVSLSIGPTDRVADHPFVCPAGCFPPTFVLS